MSGWYLRSGRSGAWTYAVMTPGSISLVPDFNEATRFETKADAVVAQMEIVAELGIEVSCISDCPKAAQQAQTQDLAAREDLDAVYARYPKIVRALSQTGRLDD